MPDDADFEILPAGEMREKSGLIADNRPAVRLEPANVPEPLRHLIPLAERYGISDDLIRADFVAKASLAELAELRRAVQDHAEALDE